MFMPLWDDERSLAGARVSVVTPTYDRPEMLRRAVKSVAAQDYCDVEHIVVGDNCPSLDSHADELMKINPALRIINLPPPPEEMTYVPARIGRVRNAGVDAATGSLIAHLDDDNEYEPGHLSSMVAALQRRPDAALALSHRLLLIDGRVPYLERYHPWSPDLETGREVWQQYERMGIYVANSAVMRDRITFSEERDATAEPNQMLVRREVHDLFPFLTTYSQVMMEAGQCDDDVFCEQIYRTGFRVTNTGEATVRYRLGGRFNCALMARISNGHQR